MTKQTLLLMTVPIALLGSAMADTPAKDSTSAKTIKPTELSCKGFLAVDEVTRPAIVYWAEGFNSKGKPEAAEFNVERTTRLVPVLLEDCRKEPQASFWEKAKQELKRIF